jgi:serine/threonine protein kinase
MILMYQIRPLDHYNRTPAFLLNGQVKRTSPHYVAIGEHSDLYIGTLEWEPKKRVAIKVIRGATSTQDDFKRRFQQAIREAAATWVKLDNPHVAHIYGIAEDQGIMPAIISTYYSQGNVIDYIKKHNSPSERRLELVNDIAVGLDYLHAKCNPPVIHGDLRGSNVLVGEDGQAVLSDFGLSFIIQSSDFTSVKTAGTCRWTAPEIMNPPEETPPDAPSVPYSLPGDIYAFAMTTLEIYTGYAPFHEKKNDSAVIFMVIDGKRPALPKEIEECHLKQLVEKCWRQEPSERPVSTEVVRHLSENTPKPGFFQWVWEKFSAYFSSFGSRY